MKAIEPILNNDVIIKHTVNWIKSVVIDCNFCPFAAKAMNAGRVRYCVLPHADSIDLLSILSPEFKMLQKDPGIETTFLVFPNSYETFEKYLAVVKKAERLLSKAKYDGVFQLASFHPLYRFADAEETDAANYTNRSPYPMLQILREKSITAALKYFTAAPDIPETNIAFARTKGLRYMQLLKAACIK